MASLHGPSALPSYWLHHAVAKGDLKLIRELLLNPQFPANKKVECPNGTVYYPLHVALYVQNSTAQKILIDAGATPELVTNDFRKKYKLPLLPQELEEPSKKQKITSDACDNGKDSIGKEPSSDSRGDREQGKERGNGSSISSKAAEAATNGSKMDADGAGIKPSSGVQARSGGGDSSSKQEATAVAVATGRNDNADIPDDCSSSYSDSDCDSMTSSCCDECDDTAEEFRRAGAGHVSRMAVEDLYSQWYSRQCTFVECLLEWKADVSGVADHHLGTSWLHETVRHKLSCNLPKRLVDAGTPLDAGDGKGNTALHFSLEIDELQMAMTLLQLGANMNLYNKIGFTSFGCACMNGEAATINHMITLGADVNGGSRQPLFLTCKAYLAKMMYRHCETGGVVLQDQQTAWRSQWAADKKLRAVYMSIAKSLLSHGADPQARDDEGNFPLLAAAESGFHEVIPDLAAADTYRAALAAIAAIEEYAKANSGSVSAEARAAASAARAAAAAGDAAAKARALQKVPAAELAKAAEKAGVDVATLLADVAPSANRCNNTEAVTPMMMAVSWGYTSAVEALVKAGADPNQAAGVPKKKQPIFIAAKLGHLDVVTKLVELGADWPHGRAAAIVGNDVVQMLVENYKGAKKLQPSVVVKLLGAAEKRGQQARAKQSTMTDTNSESESNPTPVPAATAVTGSTSSSKAHEAMMQLLMLEEREKQQQQQQQQQKAGSSAASKKNKKKKEKKKKKLASVTQGSQGDEGSEAEQEAAAAAANDAALGTASAAAAAADFANLALNDSSSSSAAASSGATAAAGAACKSGASAKAPDGASTAVKQQQQQRQQQQRNPFEDQQVLPDLLLQLEKLGLKVPDGDSLEQLRSILTATLHKEGQQQQQQQNGAVGVADRTAVDSAELATRSAAAAAAGGKSDSKGTNKMFVFGSGSEQGEQTAGVDTVGISQQLGKAAVGKGKAAVDKAVDADVQSELAAAVAAAALLPLPQVAEAQAAEEGDRPEPAAMGRGVAASRRQGADVTHGNNPSSSSSSGTASSTSTVPKSKASTVDGAAAAGAAAATDPSSSSSKSGLTTGVKPLQAKQGPAAGKAPASSSSSMDGSNKKDQAHVPQNQPNKHVQAVTEASEAATRAMAAISGRSTAGHTSGGGAGGFKVVKQEASVGSAGPGLLAALQSSSKHKRQSDSNTSSQVGSSAAAVTSGPTAVTHDPTVSSGFSAAVQGSSSHSTQQKRQSDGGSSSQAASGAVAHTTHDHVYRPDKRVGDLEPPSTTRTGSDFTEVLSRQDKEVSRRSQKLAATAAAAAAAAVAGSSKAAASRPSVIGGSRSSSTGGGGVGSSSLQPLAGGVRSEGGGSNPSSSGCCYGSSGVDPWATPYQNTDALHHHASAAAAAGGRGSHSSNSSATLNPAAAAFQPHTAYSAAAAAPCPDMTSSRTLQSRTTAAAHPDYPAAPLFPARSNSEPVPVTEPNPGAAAVAGLSADGTYPTSTTAAAAAATNKVSRLLPPHLRFGSSGAGTSTAAASATSSSTASSPVVSLQQQQQPWAGAGDTWASGAAQQQQQAWARTGESVTSATAQQLQQQQPWAGADQATASGAAQQQQQRQPWGGAGVQQQYAGLSQGPASSGGSAQAPQQQQWLQPQQVMAQGAAIGSSAHQYIQPSQQQQQFAYSQGAPPAYASVATQPATSASMAAADSSATAIPSQQWQQASAAAPVQQLQPGVQYNTAPPQQHWQSGGAPLSQQSTAPPQQHWQPGGAPLSQQQQYTSYPSYSTASLMQPDAGGGPASGSSNSGSNLVSATHISSNMGVPPLAAAAGPGSSWGPGPFTGSVRYVQREWPLQQPQQQHSGPPMQQPWQQQPQQQWQQYGPPPEQWQQHGQRVAISQPQQSYAAPLPQQQTYPLPMATAAPASDNWTYGPPPPATANAAAGYVSSAAADPPACYQPPLAATTGASTAGSGPPLKSPKSSNNESMGAAALQELQRLQEKYENMTCCVVCLDHPRSVLLLPCKHLALCEECSGNLQAGGGGGECPVCRVPIVQHISGVYMT